MNYVPNDNSKDEFLCIWFVVSFIYVLHGNKNMFMVIVIVIVTDSVPLGVAHDYG